MRIISKSTYLILCLSFIFVYGCKGKKVKYQHEIKYYYEWDELPFNNFSDTFLINILGKPEMNCEFELYDSSDLWPLRMSLIKFLPQQTDTIVMKELFWKKNDLYLYIWLLKKDSIWHSVDGIMYDPEYVEF
jgi:hypothetical protein